MVKVEGVGLYEGWWDPRKKREVRYASGLCDRWAVSRRALTLCVVAPGLWKNGV